MKRVAFAAVLLGLVWLVLEGIAFATYYLAEDLYDHRVPVLARMTPRALEAFRNGPGDPVLGWDPRGPATVEEPNCLGELVAYDVDSHGARSYPGYDGLTADVVVVGDSYTQGAEVPGGETYPAQLAQLLGASVANYGVGGYGPVQSFLRLQRKLALHPHARFVVLGIMYENVYRMLNRYRPVLYDKASPFSFKPYMAGGRLAPHPGEAAIADVAGARRYAEHAFAEDFWAKPQHRFPYSLSLLRAVRSNFFYFRKLQKRLRVFGVHEYFLTFRSEAVGAGLFGLLDLYAEFADSRGVIPVVLFIPRNYLDTRSVSKLIAGHRGRFPPDLVIGDLAKADVDWSAFNLVNREEDNICHPSPYGYGQIAAYAAELVRAAGSSRPDSSTSLQR